MIPRRLAGTAPAGPLLILAHYAPAALRAHPQKVRRPAHHEQIRLAEGGPGIHHRLQSTATPVAARRPSATASATSRVLPTSSHTPRWLASRVTPFREPSAREQEEHRQFYPPARVLPTMTT